MSCPPGIEKIDEAQAAHVRMRTAAVPGPFRFLPMEHRSDGNIPRSHEMSRLEGRFAQLAVQST